MATDGKTEASWQKHQLLRNIIRSQFGAFGSHHHGQKLVIDMHAGDGNGVMRKWELQDGQLFLGGLEPLSQSSAQIAVDCTKEYPETTVLLCEKSAQKRKTLREMFPVDIFPHVHILTNHANAPTIVQEHYQEMEWALILNDPEGSSSQGVPSMQAIAQQLSSDFVIVLNELGIRRHMGLKGPGPNAMTAASYATRDRDAWMLMLEQWRQRLGRKHAAWTSIYKQSSCFHFRIVVVSNFFGRVVRRPLFEDIL